MKYTKSTVMRYWSATVSQFCVWPMYIPPRGGFWERWPRNMIHSMRSRNPCGLYIHLAFTHSVGPWIAMWRELGPAPPFQPMRVLEMQWSRAFSLVAFTHSVGPSITMWGELGPAPSFPPMRVLEMQWSRAFSLVAFTHSVGPSIAVWSELGSAPPFPPMRVLEMQWSRAFSLLALTHSFGPSITVWRELGSAPPFPPMGVLEMQRSRAFSLMGGDGRDVPLTTYLLVSDKWGQVSMCYLSSVLQCSLFCFPSSLCQMHAFLW